MYICIYQVGAEVTITEELLPQEVLISLFRKSKNRGNFAAILTANLFDEDTRMNSNVWGRGKEKLDPEIMKFVKAQCFIYYPTQGNPVEEWEKCVQSIDVKSRSIKRQRKSKGMNA